ncbi:MAG TPA: MBL fold metallo-hydrolase [Gemmatimonadales bacterium]|nr:MBL fold metallo-hydrolase [Gemmatimonadales bacterium]
MRLTLLGTGTSSGVPQLGCDCAVCHSGDPRDRRFRTAALIELGETALLIDTPPELRLQLLAAGTRRIDAVLYTHEHADHVHGIDDLKLFSIGRAAPLPLYGSDATLAFLRTSYRYIFAPDAQPYSGTTTPRLTLQLLEAGRLTDVAGIPVLPLAFAHGHGRVLGFRIGPLGYVTDAKAVGEAERAALEGVELLVLNALWWRPHPTHLSIPEAVAAAKSIGARRTVLTHLTHETGHAELAARLPSGIEPGYDGQVLEIPT